MSPHRQTAKLVAAVAFAWLIVASPAAVAQAATVVFDLEDVWLDPVFSHPWEDPRQVTGSFEWTFVGEFENGTGRILDLDLPWWGSDLTDLRFTFDTTSIEITLEGNYHDLGVDVTLFLVEPLAPDQPSTIDTGRSKFDIQVGVSHQGRVVSGSVVPRPLAPGLDITGTCPGAVTLAVSGLTPGGPAALAWSTTGGLATVPAGNCVGTEVGLATPALLTVVTSDANGHASLDRTAPPVACGAFLQVIDLSTCAVSEVVVLP